MLNDGMGMQSAKFRLWGILLDKQPGSFNKKKKKEEEGKTFRWKDLKTKPAKCTVWPLFG